MIIWGRPFVATKVDGFQTWRIPAKADSWQVLSFRLRGLHRRINSLQLYKRSKLRNVALGISYGLKKGYPHSVISAKPKTYYRSTVRAAGAFIFQIIQKKLS